MSVRFASGKRTFDVKRGMSGRAIVQIESGAVSLLLLLLARAGVLYPGSLYVLGTALPMAGPPRCQGTR